MSDRWVPLHNPPKLTGKYLAPVLESGHLTTGPQVEALRRELGSYFRISPAQIVLGSSASALFQAWLDYMERKYYELRFEWNNTPWPMFKNQVRPPCHSSSVRQVTVWTDIGGSMWPVAYPISGTIFHDACHGWCLGQVADFTLVSFYPTKLCAGAEGGALFTKDQYAAHEIQTLANCGLDQPGRSPDFNNVDPWGRKGNMTDVAAALNREALEGLPARKREIQESWNLLWEEYQDVGGVKAAVRKQAAQPYLFQVFSRDVNRARELAGTNDVASQVNFPPGQFITLPCYPMSVANRQRVANVAKEISEL